MIVDINNENLYRNTRKYTKNRINNKSISVPKIESARKDLHGL